MSVRAYLRASTKDQDAKRAEDELKKFAVERKWKIAATYVENESRATLKRPELFRLLADCHPGDILLVEQIDSLTRLTVTDWDQLRAEITAREVLVVSLDLPTSWIMMTTDRDEIQGRIFHAINGMMLDVLAAIARKDYDDRRRRQQQGIATAKGRRELSRASRGHQTQRCYNRDAAARPNLGKHSSCRHATRCSNSTIARLAKRIKPPDTVSA